MSETTEKCKCICGKTCSVCGCLVEPEVTVTNKSFWDLWIQKILRNIASMKFQWLLLLYIPTIWGMFNLIPGTDPPEPWISASVGLGFLGGGFVTLALGRIYAKTKLQESDDSSNTQVLDTDK